MHKELEGHNYNEGEVVEEPLEDVDISETNVSTVELVEELHQHESMEDQSIVIKSVSRLSVDKICFIIDVVVPDIEHKRRKV